jgi:hypothetical protein
VAAQPANIGRVNDQSFVREGVGAFLKVIDDIKPRDDAALLHARNLPEIVVIDRAEFNKLVAEE